VALLKKTPIFALSHYTIFNLLKFSILKYLSLFALAFLTFFACTPAKKIATTDTKPVTNTPLSIPDILSRLEAHEIKADWLSSDASADYSGKPMSLSVSMNVRFRRDSVIWLNIKKFGFAVARAMITPDSVFMVNYVQNNYIAKDLKYVEKQFNIPADFKTLQNILLGNPIFLTDKKQLTFERNASNDVILRGKNEQWTAQYHLDAQGEILKDMLFEQPISAKKMKISYENYDILRGYAKGDSKFSYLRTIDVESPQTEKITIIIEVEPNGLEINVPKNIKFEIPSNYKRMD
jgi:Domain of unknown function (DUF4292)